MPALSPFVSMDARRRGTTLMEVLVVIVIFLVGILAVVQIFPRGFQILMTTRNNSVATALAADEMQRLKATPDQLPEMILPVRLVNGAYVVDANFNPNRLDALGDALAADGTLSLGGNPIGPWQRFSGPNVVRRVVGEGRRVPAPRQVGQNSLTYGGLMVLQFGPMDYRPATTSAPSNLSVYGNDLIQHLRDANNLEGWTDAEYFVLAPESASISVRLPSGPEIRQYRLSFSAYVASGSSYVKRDYIDLPPVTVPIGTPDPVTGRYPLYTQSLAALVPDPIGSVDTNTLRVQRAFQQLAPADPFSDTDPYEFKLLDTNLGALLFNPLANSVYFSKPNGREPLMARVNYDVYDWRILREDFRLSLTNGKPQYKLAVGSLKVANERDIDNRATTGGIPILEEPQSAPYSDTSVANEGRADNLVIVDLDTGGVVMERSESDRTPPTAAQNPFIVVNKSTGVITFNDSDNNAANGTTGRIRLTDGSYMDTALENRALRVLYRVKNEYAVQVLKAASRYVMSANATLGAGQYYVGGFAGAGGATRIYFPPMDAGAKVTIAEINYTAGTQVRRAVGQDFVVEFKTGDPLGLPCIDIRDVDTAATAFDYSTGAAVRGVQGASVTVRVLWNPATFILTNNATENMSQLNRWGQNWRRNANETYLRREEVVR